jgi:hypothetical protein
MKKFNRFELEQAIMQCWNVVDDLRTLNEEINDPVVVGLAEVYEMRFGKAFKIFEGMVAMEHEEKDKRQKSNG